MCNIYINVVLPCFTPLHCCTLFHLILCILYAILTLNIITQFLYIHLFHCNLFPSLCILPTFLNCLTILLLKHAAKKTMHRPLPRLMALEGNIVWLHDKKQQQRTAARECINRGRYIIHS